MKSLRNKPWREKYEYYVVRKEGCWEWRGNNRCAGYPIMQISGRRRRVSQLSWEIKHSRSFPEGLMACHTCDNPRCVNPDHVWAGTMSENMRDMSIKGRHVGRTGKRKTHCKWGHEFTEENTIIQKGSRGCLACRDENNRLRIRIAGARYCIPRAFSESLKGKDDKRK